MMINWSNGNKTTQKVNEREEREMEGGERERIYLVV